MGDPESDKENDDAGTIWRLRPSEDHGLEALGGPIVIELADKLGSTLASISIPSETIDELIQPHVSIFAELQLDGSVLLDSEFFALFPTSNTIDIYELVKEGIAPDMLEDEPNVRERLAILRKRLIDALALVDQTLSKLDK